MREHRGRHGLSNSAPDALADQQTRRGGPASRQRERGHAEHVDRVARPDVEPIETGAIGDETGHGAYRITGQLAAARDRADLRSARAEMAEKGTDDAASALVGKIRKEVDDAHEKDEAQRTFCRIGQRLR